MCILSSAVCKPACAKAITKYTGAYQGGRGPEKLRVGFDVDNGHSGDEVQRGERNLCKKKTEKLWDSLRGVR